jgi:hypothetical protein
LNMINGLELFIFIRVYSYFQQYLIYIMVVNFIGIFVIWVVSIFIQEFYKIFSTFVSPK